MAHIAFTYPSKIRAWWTPCLLAAALAVCAGSANAETTECTGILAAGTYDNVNVPANTTCAFSDEGGTITVTGNLAVEAGASLLTTRKLHGIPTTYTVNGSLLGADAASIALSTVRTPIAINILGGVHLTGTTTEIALFGLSIGGVLSVADSSVGIFNLSVNNVGGNVLVRDNTISQAFDIIGNVIGGSLVCQGDTPAPFPTAELNTVGGNKVGQCANL